MSQQNQLASVEGTGYADPVVSDEFLAKREAPSEGERALMRAVLQSAIEIVHKHSKATTSEGRRAFTEALRWIKSTDTQWQYSFENVCDALDLSASYLRRGILARLRDGNDHEIQIDEELIDTTNDDDDDADPVAASYATAV